MIEIQIGKKIFKAPEKWAECSDKQIRALLVLSVLKQLPSNLWVTLIQVCLGASNRFMKNLVLSSDQFEQLKGQFSWIFTERISSFPNDGFTFKGTKYYYPADGFDDSTAEDMSLGALYFIDFTSEFSTLLELTEKSASAVGQREEPQYNLEKLIAVFCRPKRPESEITAKDWNGDLRDGYVEYSSLKRAELFIKLPVQIKLMFLQWFETHFTKFLEDYEQIFGGPSTTLRGRKRESRYPDGRGLIIMLKNVAKAGYLGDLDKVKKTNVHVVWSYMLDDVLDYNEQTDGN